MVLWFILVRITKVMIELCYFEISLSSCTWGIERNSFALYLKKPDNKKKWSTLTLKFFHLSCVLSHLSIYLCFFFLLFFFILCVCCYDLSHSFCFVTFTCAKIIGCPQKALLVTSRLTKYFSTGTSLDNARF